MVDDRFRPVLHANAAALSAFRILPDGQGRAYSISEASSGRVAIERSLRIASTLGYVAAAGQESYAVLDVLDDQDDIVQDFAIPTARAFRWWKRQLNLRVVDEPNEESTSSPPASAEPRPVAPTQGDTA